MPPFAAAKASQIAQFETRSGDPGTVDAFRLKAIPNGDTLDLYVVRASGETAARLVVGDVNGDTVAGAGAYSGSELTVKNAARHFMAQRADGSLTLLIPDGGDAHEAPVLGVAPRFRVVTTSQTATAELDHPWFFETADSAYFVSSEPGLATVWEIAAIPASAFPVSKAAATVSASAATKAAIGHPWAAAQNSLSATVASQAALQVGKSDLSDAPKALASARDRFLYDRSGALAHVYPSVDVRIETAFHPHVNAFAARLKQGVDPLLSIETQSLGNPYLHAPWYRGDLISTAASGPACLIEGGVQRDPVASRPGNFEDSFTTAADEQMCTYDFVAAVAVAHRHPAGALLALMSPPSSSTARVRGVGVASVPAGSFGLRKFADLGGIISLARTSRRFMHGPPMCRQILKGAKRADLPVEQPTTSNW